MNDVKFHICLLKKDRTKSHLLKSAASCGIGQSLLSAGCSTDSDKFLYLAYIVTHQPKNVNSFLQNYKSREDIKSLPAYAAAVVKAVTDEYKHSKEVYEQNKLNAALINKKNINTSTLPLTTNTATYLTAESLLYLY